jgi:hypothetical protein
LPAGAAGFVYLNLAHTAGPFDRERELLLAVHDEADPHGPALFRQPVTLRPPAVTDPVRLVPAGPGRYTFEGREAPAYLSRWWSPPAVAYSLPDPPRPELALEIAGNNLEVRLETAAGPRAIARLLDSIAFGDIGSARAFEAELYHFTGPYYVLRLWFSWLWKAGLATWGHEIPDAERFDLVIDAIAGRALYAATDTHWREAWAPAPDSGAPVEAQIGLFSSSVLANKSRLQRKKRDQYLDWMLAFHAAPETRPRPHIPADIVRRALEEGIAATDLGPGLEAHVPYFTNCPRPEGENFVSSDPRQG